MIGVNEEAATETGATPDAKVRAAGDSLPTAPPRAAPNDADPQYSLATALTPKVGNGEAHTMRVQYLRRGLLDVRLDGHHVIRLKINLAKRLALRHGRAYLGFTAGTGACTEDATVTHIRFTPGG